MISLLSLGMQQLSDAIKQASNSAVQNDPHIMTDEDRTILSDAILAALLHLYGNHAGTAAARVGVDVPENMDALRTFADEQAQAIQSRINDTFASAESAASAQLTIAKENEVQQNYIESWAKSTALEDVYTTRRPDGTTPANDAPWVWTQMTDYPDGCNDAMNRGSATRDELIAIAGGKPPVHPYCRCSLDQIDTSTKASLGRGTKDRREVSMSHLKFAEGTDDSEIEGLLVPFGGPIAGKDMQGEFFSENTDLCLDWFPTQERPLLFHHGVDASIKAEPIGRITSIDQGADGWWIKAWLDKSSKHYAKVKTLIDEKAAGMSSGSMHHLTRLSRTGEVLRWPLIEGSITPTPVNTDAVLDWVTAKSHFKAAGIDGEETQEALDSIKAKMGAEERNALPDSDFAYIDSKGDRHLPINDGEHVRAAMTRFDQQEFESDDAKKSAAKKIIARAKKLGIDVADDNPVGKIAAKAADLDAIKSLEGSYEDLLEDLSALLNPPTPFGGQSYSSIVATFPAYVIVKRCDYGEDDDTYWKVGYTIGDDGDPVLGDAEQVEQTYVPAKALLESPLTLDAQSVGRHASALVERTKDLHERRVTESRVLSVANQIALATTASELEQASQSIKALLDATHATEEAQVKAKALASPEGLKRRMAALDLLLETLPA